MVVGEVAVREPTCTGNGVAEVERHSSSSPASPPPALKRVSQVPIYYWVNRERVIEKCHPQAVF